MGPGSVLNLFLPQQVTLVVLAGASSSANVQRCREKGWSYEFNRLNEIDRERSDDDVDAAVDVEGGVAGVGTSRKVTNVVQAELDCSTNLT